MIGKIKRNFRGQVQHERKHDTRSSEEYSASSLISRVPPEIIGEILGWASTQKELETGHTDYDQQTLLSILLVCKHWRTIACNTPDLWCKAHLKLVTLYDPLKIHAVDAWLKRSGDFALDLSIWTGVSEERDSIDMEVYHPGDPLFKSLIDMIISHIPRCRRLTLNVLPTILPTFLTFLTTTKMSRLELLLVNGYTGNTIIPPVIFLDLANFPSLKTLVTDSTVVDFVGQSDSVHTISTNSNPRGEMLRLLQLCPSAKTYDLLIEFKVDFAQHHRTDAFHLEHHHLETLRISMEDDPADQLVSLLDDVTIPALQKLIFKRHSGRVTPGHHLTSMLQRSKPPLLKLTLGNIPIEESDLINALSCIPTLESLKFRIINPNSHSIWQALTQVTGNSSNTSRGTTSESSSHTGLCPRLSKLKVFSSPYDRPPETSVLPVMTSMLLSRCPEHNGLANGGLKHLRLVRVMPLRDEILFAETPEVKACIAHGMELSFLFPVKQELLY